MITNRFEAFSKKYHPVPVGNLDGEGGIDLEYLREAEQLPTGTDFHYFWTVVQVEGDELIYPGYHPVDRIAYILCEVPWTEEEEGDGGSTWYYWTVGAETEWVEKLAQHRGRTVEIKGDPLQVWDQDALLFGKADFDHFVEDYSDDQGDEEAVEASYRRLVRNTLAPHRLHRVVVDARTSDQAIFNATLTCETCPRLLLDPDILSEIASDGEDYE